MIRWRWLWVGILSLTILIVGGCQIAKPPARGVVHLTLWHSINPPSNRDVFDRLVAQFNQTHPTVQVDALYTGQSDQQLPKILTAVVGNALPDMLWFDNILTGRLVDLGAIVPLEDWLNTSPRKSEIEPALFEGMTLEGHTWSIPFTTNNVAIFYRPNLFRAVGITQVPQTWEALRQVASKLTQDQNGDGRIDQYGMVLPLGKGEWTVFTWLPFMFSARGNLLKDGRPDLENPGAVAALQFWMDLLKDGSAVLSAPERGYEQDDFIAGKIAMQITGPWTLGFLQQTGIEFDVMPIPASQERATVVGGANLFLMKTSEAHQKAALQFLDYVLSEEFQVAWAIGTGSLPINIKARESAEYQAYVAKQPVLKVFLDQMAVARSRPNIPSYSRLSENLGRAIEGSLLGRSPVSTLRESQSRLELILGDSKMTQQAEQVNPSPQSIDS